MQAIALRLNASCLQDHGPWMMDHTCHVCHKEVEGAHTCKRCKKSVHLICGTAQGEEGYGQQVICKVCQNGNYTIL